MRSALVSSLATVLLAAALLVGCASGDPGTSGVAGGATSSPEAADPGATGAPAAAATSDPDEAARLYEGFPDCDPLPTSTPADGPRGPVPGLVDLGDAWVEQVSETPPLVTVTGLVDATPIDIRDRFAGDDAVELVYIEDEGYEVEMLLDVDGRRTFVKGTIRCRTGSVFAQIIGPPGDADLLPVPGQQAGG